MNLINLDDYQEDREPRHKKMKRSTWTQNDEELFLKCWEVFHPQLRNCLRNSHVYVEMAAHMNDKFSPEEVKIKVKNFSQRYRNERKKMSQTGEFQSQWHYYKHVHKIIDGSSPNHNEIDENCYTEYLSDTADVLEESDQQSPELVSPEPSRDPLPSSSDTLDRIRAQGEEFKTLFNQAVKDNKAVSQEIITLLREQNENSRKMLRLLEKFVEKS